MDILFLNGKLKSKGNFKLAGIFLVGITNQRLPKTQSKNADCFRKTNQALPKTLPKHEVRFLKSKQTFPKTLPKYEGRFRATDVFFIPSYLLGLKSSE